MIIVNFSVENNQFNLFTLRKYFLPFQKYLTKMLNKIIKTIFVFLFFMISFMPKTTNAACQFTCGPISIDTINHQVTISFDNHCNCNVTNYFWDYGNGFTDTFQHGGSSFPYPGTYIVKVFGMCSNGSIDSSVHTVLVDYPNNIICNFITSDNISEQSNHKFSAFPNPFNDQLHFDNPSEEGYIKIYNTLGNQVLFKKIGTGLVNLDVSLLIDGIYFLHYFDGILSKKNYFN